MCLCKSIPITYVMERPVDQCAAPVSARSFILKAFFVEIMIPYCKLKSLLCLDFRKRPDCSEYLPLFLSYLSSSEYLRVLSLVCMSEGESRKYTAEQIVRLHSCIAHLSHESQKKNVLFLDRGKSLGMDGKCLSSC